MQVDEEEEDGRGHGRFSLSRWPEEVYGEEDSVLYPVTELDPNKVQCVMQYPVPFLCCSTLYLSCAVVPCTFLVRQSRRARTLGVRNDSGTVKWTSWTFCGLCSTEYALNNVYILFRVGVQPPERLACSPARMAIRSYVIQTLCGRKAFLAPVRV